MDFDGGTPHTFDFQVVTENKKKIVYEGKELLL